jgi:hypothetical protein
MRWRKIVEKNADIAILFALYLAMLALLLFIAI